MPPEYANGDAAAGKALFASKGCGVATRWSGGLDRHGRPQPGRGKPSEALIADRVVNGKGAMPPFKTS